jgi:hypothetical protein
MPCLLGNSRLTVERRKHILKSGGQKRGVVIDRESRAIDLNKLARGKIKQRRIKNNSLVCEIQAVFDPINLPL